MIITHHHNSSSKKKKKKKEKKEEEEESLLSPLSPLPSSSLSFKGSSLHSVMIPHGPDVTTFIKGTVLRIIYSS